MYISISASDRSGTRTHSSSDINDEEKAKAKEFIDSLEFEAPATSQPVDEPTTGETEPTA